MNLGARAAAGLVLLLLWTAPLRARRPAAGLVPGDQDLLVEIDARRLRQIGPPDTVGRLQAALSPRLAELGLRAEGVSRLVIGGSPDGSVRKRPLLLVIEQDPPDGERGLDLERLRAALGDGGHGRAEQHRGVRYLRGRRLGVAALPDGPVVVASLSLLPRVLDLWHGRGESDLLSGAAARLLGRLGGDPSLRLWLRPRGGLVRDLLAGGLPAAPLALAAQLRPASEIGGGVELRALLQMGSVERAQALGAWLRERLMQLQGEFQVQLLGLSGVLKATEVGASGDEVTVRLPIGRGEYAALLDRLVGLTHLLSLRLGREVSL